MNELIKCIEKDPLSANAVIDFGKSYKRFCGRLEIEQSTVYLKRAEDLCKIGKTEFYNLLEGELN